MKHFGEILILNVARDIARASKPRDAKLFSLLPVGANWETFDTKINKDTVQRSCMRSSNRACTKLLQGRCFMLAWWVIMLNAVDKACSGGF